MELIPPLIYSYNITTIDKLHLHQMNPQSINNPINKNQQQIPNKEHGFIGDQLVSNQPISSSQQFQQSKPQNTNIIGILQQQLSIGRKIPNTLLTAFQMKLYPVAQYQSNIYISLYKSIIQFMAIFFKRQVNANIINLKDAKYKEIVIQIVKIAATFNDDLRSGMAQFFDKANVKEKLLQKLKIKDLPKKKQEINLLSAIVMKNKAKTTHYDFNGINRITQSIKQRQKVFNLTPKFQSRDQTTCMICDKQLLIGRSNIFKCLQCFKQFHRRCNDRVYNCVFCQLKNMNPLKPVKQELFVGILERNTKRHDLVFNFIENNNSSFIPEKFKALNVNINNKPSIVQVRSLRIKETYDHNSSYITLFPDACNFILNNRLIKDFNPLHRQSSLKYRRDQPIKLTNHSQLKHGENNVSIIERFLKKDLKSDERVESENHLIGIYIIKDHCPFLEKSITNFETISFNESINLLKGSLLISSEENNEQDLACENSQISLVCSLTLSKLVYPGRSIFCTHFSCFDLYNFIKLNSQASIPKWLCPICKAPAYQFRLDPIIKSILDFTGNDQQYGLNIKRKRHRSEWVKVLFDRTLKFKALNEKDQEGQTISVYDLPFQEMFKRSSNVPLLGINEFNVEEKMKKDEISDNKQSGQKQEKVKGDDGAHDQQKKIEDQQKLEGKQIQQGLRQAPQGNVQELQDNIRKVEQELDGKSKNKSQISTKNKNYILNKAQILNSQFLQNKERRSLASQKKDKKDFVIPKPCDIIQISD